MKKPTFKKGDRVICINDSGSANILKINRLYIIEGDSFYFNDFEFITLKNTGSFFNVNRFKKITEDRKQKLKKIYENR